MSPCSCAFGTCMDQVRMLDLSAHGFVDAWKPSATPVSGGNGAEMFCTPDSSDDRDTSCTVHAGQAQLTCRSPGRGSG